MQELRPGTRLQGGKYIIKRLLGQGGFGITYLAEQVSHHREVAIKEFFMKSNCVRDYATRRIDVPATANAELVKQYLKKFLKEAQMLSTMTHPHIVNVKEIFEENNTAYYTMPLFHGGALSSRIEKNGCLSETEALRYIRQIADALKYMHEVKKVCHFDVKPANILIDENDNAVLVDFGLCKHYDDKGGETSSTPIGISEGYAPIEQYRQMVNEFSPASDFYGLGATLYYLLMGKTPPSAIILAEGERLVINDKVSTSTKRIIEQSMMVSAKDRPQTMDAFFSGTHETTIDPNNGTHGPKNNNVKRVLIGTLISILLFVFGGATYRFFKQDPNQNINIDGINQDSINNVNRLPFDTIITDDLGSMNNTVEQHDSLIAAQSSYNTDIIVKRIRHIYNLVSNGQYLQNERGFNAKYCSKAWNKLYYKVVELDEKEMKEGYVGFLNFDIWTMSQDPDGFYVSDIRVNQIDSEHATAAIVTDIRGYKTNVRLWLVLEQGEWKIDNFEDLDEFPPINYGDEMRKYLKNGYVDLG